MSKKKLSGANHHFEGRLFGLVTQLRDYLLCWHLNRELGLNMEMMDDLEVTNRKKKKTSLFSWFRCEVELDMWLVYLVSNKHGGDFFLPELKQPDFIFMIKGEVSDERCAEILSAIRKIDSIQLAIEVPVAKLKSGENLVLE